jgi:hypothetical protein
MTFDANKLNQVVEIAKAKSAGNARWLSAIERAAEGLRGGWIVTEHASLDFISAVALLNNYF